MENLAFESSGRERTQRLSSTSDLSTSELLAPAAVVDGGLLMREAQVLGPGFVSGVKQGLGKSLQDLQQFEDSLWKDPLGTMSEFAANHWSEAAVGAAITFLSPKKWANTLLMAASMRGVATSTFEGMMLAANPNNDLEAVRQRYARSMAQETNALVNALPATLAGGAVGRIGANTLFGKGMGAWDLAARDVTMADVRGNLWKLHDQILPPKAKIAVFDLDGTLVSTAEHLAKGIEKATQVVADNTGLPQDVVAKAVGEQFGKLQSFTHPWTLELALSEKLNVGKPGGMTFEQFKAQVSDPYWQTIADMAPDHLRVYEGVHATFDGLAKEGVKSIIHTSSPAATAMGRIRVTELEPHVRTIFALKHLPPPEGLAPELVAHGQARLDAILQPPPAKLRQIPRELRKPDPTIMNAIAERNNVRPNEILMIGDSLKDDMGIAQNSGVRGFWARYSEVDAPYDAMLNKVTGNNYTMGKPKVMPKFEGELHQISDILKHLRPERDLLGYGRSISGLPAWHLPLTTYGLTLTPRDK